MDAFRITVLILFGWLITGATLLGIGLLVWRKQKDAPLVLGDLFNAFWLGFGVWLVLLLGLHLVMPIRGWLWLPGAALGLAGLYRHAGGLSRVARDAWRTSPYAAFAIRE